VTRITSLATLAQQHTKEPIHTGHNHHPGQEAVQLEDQTSEILPRLHATATPNLDQESLQPPRPGWSCSEPDQRLKSLLTAREVEILQEIVNGASNAQISSNLNISQETVKTHVKNILHKLQARDRTQAVVIALRASLVSFPE